MDIFNNREIALLIWCIVIAVWTISKPELRQSFSNVFDAAFKKVILIPIIIYGIYVGVSCFSLNGLGLWDESQVKNTIIWSIFVGIAALFHVATDSEHQEFFKDWIRDQFKAIVLVEFIVSLDSFSLLVEIIMLPLITIIVLMETLARRKEEHIKVAKLLSFILSGFGVFLLYHALHAIWIDLDSVETIETLKDFYTPIALSLSLLPFLYALYIYTSYENIYSTMQFAIKDNKLEKYAKLLAALSFRSDIEFLKRWNRKIRLSDLTDKKDIRKSISEIKQREKNPPQIDPHEGWSPYTAQKFLEEHEIYSSDYHEQYGEWFSGSDYLEIKDGYKLSNTIAYYIDGNETTAKKLKIVLDVGNQDVKARSEELFLECAKTLFKKATDQDITNEFLNLLHTEDGTLRPNNFLQISISSEKWSGGLKDGYTKRIILEIIIH